MKFYAYSCRFYDEDYKELDESGFVCADTYATAAAQLSQYYGSDSIINFTLSVYSMPDTPLILPQDTVISMLDSRE